MNNSWEHPGKFLTTKNTKLKSFAKKICRMAKTMLNLSKFRQNPHPVWAKMMEKYFDVESW
jgi:hypothetical protein